MRLGLLQTKHNDLYQFLSPSFSLGREDCLSLQAQQVEQNFALLESARPGVFDLLVTTECVDFIRTSAGNSPEDAALYPALDCRWTQRFSQAAKRLGSWLAVGFGFREGNGAVNGALLFDRGGRLDAVYRKIHLAGEEPRVFTPGDCFCVRETDFGALGLCICWDMQFPETARTLALRGAQLIACPTWGWEADLYGRARAYENGVFAAAAMAVPAWGSVEPPRTPSSAVAPDGSLLVCGPADRAALVACDLDLAAAEPDCALRLGGRRPSLYGALTETAVQGKT